MRFALIGYGAWGRYHARAIANLDGVELAAIACHSETTALEARRDYPNARVCIDWREAVNDAAVDVVDIVAPNYLHADIGCAALEAGKDVLLEKPMATTKEDCDRLIITARASGRVLSIGHEFRLSTQWGRAKDLLDDCAIGDPLFVNINLFRNFYRNGADGWRYDRRRVGSWILEEAVHFFDFALWYLASRGDPLSVRAFGNQRAGRSTGMYDNFSACLRFGGSALATITQSVGGFEHHLIVEIVGSEGAIRTAWDGTMDRDHDPVYDFRVQRRGFNFERGVREAEREPIAPSGEVYELEEELRLTARALRERRALISAEDARKRVICCLESERSIREDREIPLSFDIS